MEEKSREELLKMQEELMKRVTWLYLCYARKQNQDLLNTLLDMQSFLMEIRYKYLL